MPGIKGKSGGARKGAGRKRDSLRVGKEIYLRRKWSHGVEVGRVFVVMEYTAQRIVFREKSSDDPEEIIIRYGDDGPAKKIAEHVREIGWPINDHPDPPKSNGKAHK